MKKLFYGILFGLMFSSALLVPDKAEASHLAGGDFVIEYDGNPFSPNTTLRYRHKLILTLFRDRGSRTTSPISAPSNGPVAAFRKNPIGQDQFVECFTLLPSADSSCFSDLTSDLSGCNLPWYNTECGQDSVVTLPADQRPFALGWHQYELTATLAPTDYGSPIGYYFAWGVCCRNNNITNLSSSSGAAQAVVTEFPPVVRGGVQFVNNSPKPGLPFGDYACINQSYELVFSSVDGNPNPFRDADGDSIEYILADPLDESISCFGTSTPGTWTNASQIGRTNFYPTVTWAPGRNANNPIPPSDNLASNRLIIDNAGVLRFKSNAAVESRFVFAVRLIEWRQDPVTLEWDSIGSVLRDFQVSVLECTSAEQPIADPVEDPSVEITPGDQPFDPNDPTLEEYYRNAIGSGGGITRFEVFPNRDSISPQIYKTSIDTIQILQYGVNDTSCVFSDDTLLGSDYRAGIEIFYTNTDGSVPDRNTNNDCLDELLLEGRGNTGGFILNVGDTIVANITWDQCTFTEFDRDANGNVVIDPVTNLPVRKPIIYAVTRFNPGCPRAFEDTAIYEIYLPYPENMDPELQWFPDQQEDSDQPVTIKYADPNATSGAYDTILMTYDYQRFLSVDSVDGEAVYSLNDTSAAFSDSLGLNWLLVDLDNDAIAYDIDVFATEQKDSDGDGFLDNFNDSVNSTTGENSLVEITNRLNTSYFGFRLFNPDTNTTAVTDPGLFGSLERYIDTGANVPANTLVTDTTAEDSAQVLGVQGAKLGKLIFRPTCQEMADLRYAFQNRTTDGELRSDEAYPKDVLKAGEVPYIDMMMVFRYRDIQPTDTAYYDDVFTMDEEELAEGYLNCITDTNWVRDRDFIGSPTVDDSIFVQPISTCLCSDVKIDTVILRIQIEESDPQFNPTFANSSPNSGSNNDRKIPELVEIDGKEYYEFNVRVNDTLTVNMDFFDADNDSIMIGAGEGQPEALLRFFAPIGQSRYKDGINYELIPDEVNTDDEPNAFVLNEDVTVEVDQNGELIEKGLYELNIFENSFISGSEIFAFQNPDDRKPGFTQRLVFNEIPSEDPTANDYELKYTPTCEDFLDFNLGDPNNTQVEMEFYYTQFSCNYVTTDTIRFRLNISGPVGEIPNVITANGDGINDVLRLSPANQKLEILQPGTTKFTDCEYTFQNIIVYNRWGAEVVKEEIRDFEFVPPANMAAGTYYYVINYDGVDPIKGWFQLFK